MLLYGEREEEAGGITDENLCILGLVSTCIVIFTYYVLLPVLYESLSWNKGSEFLIPDFFLKKVPGNLLNCNQNTI